MPNISVKIENIDAIRSALRKAPEKMTKELDKAIKKAILKIESGAVKNVPVRTGFLRNYRTLEFSMLTGSLSFNAVESENDSVQQLFVKAVDDVLESIARDSNS
jgi:hypothetical protein